MNSNNGRGRGVKEKIGETCHFRCKSTQQRTSNYSALERDKVGNFKEHLGGGEEKKKKSKKGRSVHWGWMREWVNTFYTYVAGSSSSLLSAGLDCRVNLGKKEFVQHEL